MQQQLPMPVALQGLRRAAARLCRAVQQEPFERIALSERIALTFHFTVPARSEEAA